MGPLLMHLVDDNLLVCGRTSVKTIFWISWIIIVLVCSGCATGHKLPAVRGFEAERYLGTWYEIARLPNRFEEGLSDISAHYALLGDRLKVTNRGYDVEQGKWREAIGRAYFPSGKQVGELRVTFFWPFYAWYVVLDLDRHNYTYALVGSGKYLWILAREPTLPEHILKKLITQASSMGYDIQKLIFVSHGRPEGNPPD